VTQPVPLLEQELLTLLQHLSSPLYFLWGLRYSILSFMCNVFWIVICPFSFGHCVVFHSSVYRFWLPLWYLQTHLAENQLVIIQTYHFSSWVENLHLFKYSCSIISNSNISICSLYLKIKTCLSMITTIIPNSLQLFIVFAMFL